MHNPPRKMGLELVWVIVLLKLAYQYVCGSMLFLATIIVKTSQSWIEFWESYVSSEIMQWFGAGSEPCGILGCSFFVVLLCLFIS